ncbi:uncharacterized protein LOC130932606 isoform X1 [Arachis stenosperma]|uniref:uncharacterized protein LOC130932606 isoform X1 n=1 Tax=Arachis stenosperma TaxID=217475 RepID=UPI0025ACB93D|nr:uncharacterized protein LOC130932606 isoform X1 [Arachis stenosperma]
MNHHHNHQDNNNGDVLNTMVESLRGRLLAERHASRLARDKAQSFENRFVELKNKLRQETKLRDKAQRKLEFFKEKLQSFNISYLDPNHQSTENLRNNNDNDISRLSLSPSSSKISATSYDHVSNHTINPSNVDLKNDHNSLSTKASSVMEEKEDNDFDNSLALVPVNVTLVSTNNNNNNNERAVHESVIEALDALRRAKEGLVCAMMATTKPIIKVGPTYNLEDTNNDKAKLFMY